MDRYAGGSDWEEEWSGFKLSRLVEHKVVIYEYSDKQSKLWIIMVIFTVLGAIQQMGIRKFIYKKRVAIQKQLQIV